MNDQKDNILAIVLSALVLIGWQFYFGTPQQKPIQQQQSQQAPAAPQQPGAAPPAPGTAPQAPGPAAPGQPVTREAALAASPRVRIETPSLAGSIALRGARIDDPSLVKHRQTVEPNAPPTALLCP